jgi:hypothetical protein
VSEPETAHGPNGGGAATQAELRALMDGMPAELRALADSVLLQRLQWMRQAGLTFGGDRDEYKILGYDRDISNEQYRDEYARGGIAGRIIDALPNATWRGSMELIEDENPDVITPFEQAWDDLDTRLQIQAKLLRVDKLAGLSAYAVLLIGAPGELSEPLSKGSPDKLLYLTPFTGGGGPGGSRNSRQYAAIGADATIFEYEDDHTNSRFGLPRSYQLKRTDIATPAFARPVHWTRIIHVAENLLDDEVFGQPTLERVWNLLIDLRKVTGGGAEAFWLRANQGLHLNVDKDMQLESTKDTLTALKDQADLYKHQIDRWIRTKGVEVDVLGSDVANFQNPADAILTQIAGAKAIPKRILTGSEMGELASSQDRDNWKDQVNGRQTGYAGPYIVRPLVDRLIEYGYLPEPAKGVRAYEVRWPQITTMTEQEKVAGASGWASVNSTMGQTVFTDTEIREKWADKGPLSDEQRAEILKQKQEAMAMAQEAMQQEKRGKVLPFGKKDKDDDDEDEPTERVPRAAQDKPRDYSSTQVQLPSHIAKKLLAYGASIPDADLAADGREDDPHVTVKYGLHTEDVDDVSSLIPDFGPVELTLGETAFFSNDEHDVLYVAVESPDLARLNKLVSTLETTDTHPTYVPHACVAYLKPGLGKKYAGDARFEGAKAEIGSVVFSDKTGEKEVVELGLRAAAFDPDQPRDEDGQWADAGGSHKVGDQVTGSGSAANVELRGRPLIVKEVDEEKELYRVENRAGIDFGWHKAEDLRAPGEHKKGMWGKGRKGSTRIKTMEGFSEVDEEIIRVLAQAIECGAIEVIEAICGVNRAASFDPDQPRDEDGQWADVGGNSSGSTDAQLQERVKNLPEKTVVLSSKYGTVETQLEGGTRLRFVARRKSGEMVASKSTIREAKQALRQPRNPESFVSGYLSPDVKWKEKV